MAVTADSQGLGIGRKLLEAAIGRYQASGGRELFLESNSRLEPALTLYESAGFVHASPARSNLITSRRMFAWSTAPLARESQPRQIPAASRPRSAGAADFAQSP